MPLGLVFELVYLCPLGICSVSAHAPFLSFSPSRTPWFSGLSQPAPVAILNIQRIPMQPFHCRPGHVSVW